MAPTASNDGSAPDSREPRGAAPRFPTLRAARVRRLDLDPPRRFAIDGEESAQRDVVVVDVELDSLLPPMGVGYALFVGDRVLVDVEPIGENQLRFYAPAEQRWEAGAAVALGLAGSGRPRVLRRTDFKLDWPVPENPGARAR